MAPALLYIVCVLGALGLYLVVRPGGLGGLRGRRMRAVGAVMGIAAFGYLVVQAGEALGAPAGEASTPRLCWSSPLAKLSWMMSQPPRNSPFT